MSFPGLGGGIDSGQDTKGPVVVGLEAGPFGLAGWAQIAEEGLSVAGVLCPDRPGVLCGAWLAGSGPSRTFLPGACRRAGCRPV